MHASLMLSVSEVREKEGLDIFRFDLLRNPLGSYELWFDWIHKIDYDRHIAIAPSDALGVNELRERE